MLPQLNPKPLHPLLIIAPEPARLYLYEQQALSNLGLGIEHLGSKHEISFVFNYHIESGKSRSWM